LDVQDVRLDLLAEKSSKVQVDIRIKMTQGPGGGRAIGHCFAEPKSERERRIE